MKQIIIFLVALFLCQAPQNLMAGCVYAKDLEGKLMEAGNALSWSTSNEENCSFFIIERSPNGHNFEMAAKIPGAGTSKETKNYRFLDVEMNSVRVFYRLVQVDADGKSHLSDLVLINKPLGQDNFNVRRVQSMETDHFLNLAVESFYEMPLSYRVMTQMGDVLLSGQLEVIDGMNAISIDMASIDVGRYQLSLKVKNEIEVFTIKKSDVLDPNKVPLATKNK